MIKIDRAKVLEYAKAYWWRPCKDGMVRVAAVPIYLAKEAKKRKKDDYVGVFLWYPSKGSKGMWEALCLVPKSAAKEIEEAKKDGDRLWSKYASVGIALASYKDDPNDEHENLDVFPTKPPYYALNDCTHFTSECLIAGGFLVTNDKARRGAGDLADYLYASKEVTTLCYMAAHDDVQAVVDAGVVREGDVFAYYDKKGAHHTVPAVSANTIAMHTWHEYGRPWDLGKSNERISLFHFKDDDYTKADGAKKWLGWWKVETLGDAKPKVEYYHFDGTGTLTVTSEEPKNTKMNREGDSYRWFFTKAKTAVVVRRKALETKTKVETFQEPKTKETSTTTEGAFSNLPSGSKLSLKGTKLF